MICTTAQTPVQYLKLEYHSNQNQLKTSEKKVCVSQRLMYPIKKTPYHTSFFFLNAIKLKKKVYKSHCKTTVFDNYKADIYWNKISIKKIAHHTRFFLCNI